MRAAASDLIPVWFLFLLLAGAAAGQGSAPPLQASELVVRAERVAGGLPDESASVSLLGSDALEGRRADHLQDALALVPDLTAAGGTSRPRYFQVRGIGERSQFAGEGPPNFSVGFFVDDIDLSGLGMHGSLFDVNEVEVLRGPQAALYGSKGLAGVILVRTEDPTDVPQRRVRLSAGTDDYYAVGAAAGGPVTRESAALTTRVAVEHLRQDGYRRNVYLGRDDTNGRDEWTARWKWRWVPVEDVRWDLATLWSQYDNGYDAWAPDNERERTYSDRPGRDFQRTAAGSLRGVFMQPERFRVLSLTAFSHTDVDYSFDSDWGNRDFWAAPPYRWDAAREGYEYDFFERLLRTRSNFSQDVRLLSEPGDGDAAAWHVGAYGSRLEEEDEYRGSGELDSDYVASSAALYGEVGIPVAERTVLHASLRGEDRWTDYADRQGVAFSGEDLMWGGRLALDHRLDEDTLLFAAASRGFKGGGVNQNPALPRERIWYDPETVWSAETGARGRFFERCTELGLTLFYLWRWDMQIGTSFQGDPKDPTSFVYFTDNAASGRNYGAELEALQRLADGVELFGNASLLRTEYGSYESAAGTRLEGRDQPYAPQYAYLVGIRGRSPGGLFARAEVEGRDAFYLGDGHGEKSEPYEIVNAQIGYGRDAWTLTLWGRNVLDRKYITRGYRFGLEPPDYADRLYLTYGDPALFGVTLDLEF